MRIALSVGTIALLALAGCPSRRVLTLENKLLLQENGELQREVLELRRHAADPADFDPSPTLETVHRFLERAGYVHTWTPESTHIHLEFEGRNTSFGVNIQHFASADVLFIATSGYLDLHDAQDTQAMMLVFVQLSSLNYEMLLGKFQMNPETGEILLSTELHVVDGLGYESFVNALDHLCQTADAKYTELERAAAGTGL